MLLVKMEVSLCGGRKVEFLTTPEIAAFNRRDRKEKRDKKPKQNGFYVRKGRAEKMGVEEILSLFSAL